jgi:hypothetical protein
MELSEYGDHLFQVSLLVPQMPIDKQAGQQVRGVVKALQAAGKRSKLLEKMQEVPSDNAIKEL